MANKKQTYYKKLGLASINIFEKNNKLQLTFFSVDKYFEHVEITKF